MEHRDMECGYCGGRAVWSEQALRYVHADAGQRVRAGGPGDFVSGRHNEAGTVILPVDLVDLCERCGESPVKDEVSGLCQGCCDYNNGRVVL